MDLAHQSANHMTALVRLIQACRFLSESDLNPVTQSDIGQSDIGQSEIGQSEMGQSPPSAERPPAQIIVPEREARLFHQSIEFLAEIRSINTSIHLDNLSFIHQAIVAILCLSSLNRLASGQMRLEGNNIKIKLEASGLYPNAQKALVKDFHKAGDWPQSSSQLPFHFFHLTCAHHQARFELDTPNDQSLTIEVIFEP